MMTWIWIGHPNVILVEFTASETNCQAWKRSRPLYPKKRGRKSRTLPHNHNNEALSEKEKEAQREIFAASPQIKTANFQMNEPSCIVYYFKSESRKQNDRDFFSHSEMSSSTFVETLSSFFNLFCTHTSRLFIVPKKSTRLRDRISSLICRCQKSSP